MPSATRLGSYLRQCRLTLGLTSRRVAELSRARRDLTPLSHSSLLALENGHNPPSFDKLLSLAIIYQVPVESFTEHMRADMQEHAVGSQLRTAQTADELEAAADVARAEGSFALAVDRYQQSVEVLLADRGAPAAASEQVETRHRVASLRLRVAEGRVALGQLATAQSDLEGILAESMVSGELRVLAELALAEIYILKGNGHLSCLIAQDAVTRCSDRDQAMRGRACLVLGQALELADDAARAMHSYEQAVLSDSATTDVAIEASRRLGQLRLTQGAADAAIVDLGRALLAARDDQDSDSIAELLVELTRAHLSRDHRTAARETAIEAKGILDEIDRPALLFRSLYYLWRLAQLDEQASLAEAYEQRLRALELRSPDPSDELRAWREVCHSRRRLVATK